MILCLAFAVTGAMGGGDRARSRPPPLAKKGALAWDNARREGSPSHGVSRLAVHAVDDVTNRVYE